MMPVTIGSEAVKLTLHPLTAHGFDITVEADGLEIERHVYVSDQAYNRMLVAFFDDLAANWRGWEGERRWSSAERDLALVAVHDPLGRCVLEIVVRGPQASWRLSVPDLAIDVGEELSQVARDVRAWAGL